MIPLWPAWVEGDVVVTASQIRVFGPIYRVELWVWSDANRRWEQVPLPWYRRWVVSW